MAKRRNFNKEKKNDYLNTDKLLEDYEPLMKSIYKTFAKFNNLYCSYEDFEDLESQIKFEFLRLCSEYTPTRGVDFPGFIKFHLQQRVYHYITKLQRSRQRETVAFNKDSNSEYRDCLDFSNMTELVDEDTASAIERVEALACLDWSLIQSEKHRYLVESILFGRKSLEEIAKEEGVSVKVVRLRLYSVCNILIDGYNRKESGQNCDGNIDSVKLGIQKSMPRCIDDFNILRVPIITRKPIFLEEKNE